jgi:hypothetical protein
VARAEPYFGQMSIVRCAANQKGGAADARLSFDRGHNDLYRFHSNVRQFGFRVNGLPELFKLFVAGFAVTRYDRHDRTVPRRPAATVGTLRQHLFQFADLTIRGVNDHGERMIAAIRRAA